MVVTLSKGNLGLRYECMSADADVLPAQVSAIGNLDILQQKTLALFCSVKCPGSVILQTHDCMKALREAGITVIGGFHSPMENQCLNILLRGTQPVIVCPARSLEAMRIKPQFKKPLEEGRLLFLSPFPPKTNRISAERANLRNRFVAAMADRIFVAYAAPGGNIEKLCTGIPERQRPLLILDNENNRHLYGEGVRTVNPDNIRRGDVIEILKFAATLPPP